MMDETTQERVIEELESDDNLRTSTVAVSVKTGIVHLTGVVPTAADCASAERIASNVPGVVRVVNDLKVESLLR